LCFICGVLENECFHCDICGKLDCKCMICTQCGFIYIFPQSMCHCIYD
jgi:hypothetical protein